VKLKACLGLSVLVWAFQPGLQGSEIKIHRATGAVELEFSGDPAAYALEGATSTSTPGGWRSLLGFTLRGANHKWSDVAAASAPNRFYRLVKLGDARPMVTAQNFRLIDHLGKAQELFYQAPKRAVVLIFAGTDCISLTSRVSAIKSLRDRYAAQGVLIWLVGSTPESRLVLATQAAALGIDLPVLHDQSQIVARAYGVQAMPEAIVIDTSDWSVVYQGAIDDSTGIGAPPGSVQNYLDRALTELLTTQSITVHAAAPNGCPVPERPQANISYRTQIAPLLQSKCVSCHSEGNIAPWLMTNHQVVQAYGPLIKAEVLANRMPPWHADPLYGSFTNDAGLSPDQAALLLQWIDQGSPRGDGPDPLAVAQVETNYPFAWPVELGAPDHILTIPRQTIQHHGEVPYQYVDMITPFAEDVWLRAAVVKPGNTRVVHHCLVYTGTTGTLMGLDGFFAGYVPGYTARQYPAETGKLLPRGTKLRFQLHYTPTGQGETDETQVGLYLAAEPPKYSLQTRSAFNVFFSIPPNAPDHPASSTYTFEKSAYLYELSPHMHYRGSRFKYEAQYPNGTKEVLLSVPRYSFEWQTLYRFSEPKLMPAGTRLLVSGAWDNSAQNPDNPNPAMRVVFGEQTDDEMFIGYFNFAEIP
jgi:hypothetical protein